VEATAAAAAAAAAWVVRLVVVVSVVAVVNPYRLLLCMPLFSSIMITLENLIMTFVRDDEIQLDRHGVKLLSVVTFFKLWLYVDDDDDDLVIHPQLKQGYYR
jgi:hypothetical protein